MSVKDSTCNSKTRTLSQDMSSSLLIYSSAFPRPDVRDLVIGKIGDYMEAEGVRFVKECVPERLEKTDDGKIKVSAR